MKTYIEGHLDFHASQRWPQLEEVGGAGWVKVARGAGGRLFTRRFDDTLGQLSDAGSDDMYALWSRPDGTGMPLHLVYRMVDRREQHSASW